MCNSLDPDEMPSYSKLFAYDTCIIIVIGGLRVNPSFHPKFANGFMHITENNNKIVIVATASERHQLFSGRHPMLYESDRLSMTFA